MGEKRAAVIGAGLSGMACAARLAVNGFDVTVFEQSTDFGGKAGNLHQDGFRFDTGPSLLTMPFVLDELFEYCGESLDNFISLVRPEIICRYFYPDGIVLNAYSDTDKFAEEIEVKTRDKAKDVFRYLDYSGYIYELTSDLFIFNSFADVSNLLTAKAFKTLFNVMKIDPFRTMHKANSDYFSDEKTIRLFDRYATYNGSNPYSAPATLNVIQHVEYNLGCYYPEGGIYSISKAVKSLCDSKNVNFRFNTDISKIITENGRACGLQTGASETLNGFDVIVSAGDVFHTYNSLLDVNLKKKIRKVSGQERSSSAIVFYWGLKSVSSGLNLHNIIFSTDYEKEFKQLFDEKVCPEDPTIYIYISSKLNKDDAPDNCENWFVMINAPYDQGQDWEKETARMKKTILNKINEVLGIDLDERIVLEKILTPEGISEMTRSYCGSIYGLSSNSRMSAFMREQAKSKYVKGLYFCGGSVHPGGGIPLVLSSAKIASDKILKNER